MITSDWLVCLQSAGDVKVTADSNLTQGFSTPSALTVMCQHTAILFHAVCRKPWKMPLPLPGTAAGESGPVREGVTLAGEPTGDGEGPRMPGRCGEVCGEKGDWAGLLCSPWLLDTPEVLTPGLRAPSVPVGRSSMEPDRSWQEMSHTA